MNAKNKNEMQSKISDTLLRIGAVKKESLEIFSMKTRDNNCLTFFRDSTSKVIYIDDFYVGEKIYESGSYRNEFNQSSFRDFEDVTDSDRRFNSYKQFIIRKWIVDFGCGAGSFMKQSKNLAKSLVGVELQKNFIDALNKENIKCFQDINEIENKQDCIFYFIL